LANYTTGQVTITDKTKFLRQYYKYVRPGAQRIDATSSDTTLDPLAFINTDGRYVTVMKAGSAGTFRS
jgi:glucosylceramidase